MSASRDSVPIPPPQDLASFVDAGAAATEQAWNESFVDANVASGFLGCSRKHLLRLSLLGKVPAHPLPGSTQRRTWRFLISELRVWMLSDGVGDSPLKGNGRTIIGGGSR